MLHSDNKETVLDQLASVEVLEEAVLVLGEEVLLWLVEEVELFHLCIKSTFRKTQDK